jgi:hypothetical protein
MAVMKGWTPLQTRLIVAAGLRENEVADGGQHAQEFREILDALRYIGNCKVDQYGNFRMEDLRSFEREVWGAYWDIQRKFGRLETQLSQVGPQFYVDSTGLPGMVRDVMETLADQAVYCVRMIQILRRLEEKGLLPNAERTHHRNQ